MARKKAKMLNFPIALLKGFMENDGELCLLNIFSYGGYAYGNCQENDDDYGTYRSFMGGASYLGIVEEIQQCGVPGSYLIGQDAFLEHKESPKCGLSIDLLQDWFYNRSSKKKDDIVRLLMFAAFKSMFLDGKKAISTTKNFLFARMDGRATKIKSFTELSEPLQPYYNSRRIYTRLINDLVLDWGLRYYSYRMEGFGVSFSLSNKELVKKAESARKKNRIENVKNEIKNARLDFYFGN
jgi:hypothetical protein